MNMLRKSLLAVTAVFSLSPAAAFAYPPQCDEVCFGTAASCGTLCYFGTHERTTCGEVGWCFAPSPAPSVQTTSVNEEASHQAEDTASVCDSEQPRPLTAES
jgi:hypothetical protein